MLLRPLAAALCALTTAACATATGGTAPLTLAPALAQRSHVDVVRMTSDWVNGNEHLPDTFTDAIHENLARCATGPEKLDLNLHITKVHRAWRIASVLQGGTHEIAGLAELVDPSTKTVVGRYPLHLQVDAGNPVEALFSDRQLMVSDAFATELCRQAFGQG